MDLKYANFLDCQWFAKINNDSRNENQELNLSLPQIKNKTKK